MGSERDERAETGLDGRPMFNYNFALAFFLDEVAAHFPVLLNFLSQHRGV